MVVMFAFTQHRIWTAFFTFYIQGSLVQGQKLRASEKAITDSHGAMILLLLPLSFSYNLTAYDKTGQFMYILNWVKDGVGLN